MNKTNVKSWFCLPLLSILFALCTILSCKSISPGQGNPSSDIVRKILSARRDIINYRCSVEYIYTMSYESRKRDLEMARKSGELPQEIIKDREDDLQGSGKKYGLQDVVADSTGRINISKIVGDYDDAGNRHAVRKDIHVWDGEMEISYTTVGDGNYPGHAIIYPEKQKHFLFMWRPLWTFGGRFVEALERASKAGKSIEFKHNQTDGTWEISFVASVFDFDEREHAWKGIVDPAKNFSVTKGEKSQLWHGGVSRYSAEYKEFKDGIWFPVKEKTEGFYSDGVNEFITQAKITNIVINDPNLGKNAFHIDFPEGTRILDKR